MLVFDTIDSFVWRVGYRRLADRCRFITAIPLIADGQAGKRCVAASRTSHRFTWNSERER